MGHHLPRFLLEAYQNLTSQRAPHDTLLRLGAYLMGEFGHLLPQSVTPRAKFEALHRHFVRGSQQTKADCDVSGIQWHISLLPIAWEPFFY